MASALSVDLNCDLGESFGHYRLGQDADMMSLVTSINIACGLHAGDPDVMAETVAQGVAEGVSLGAHPGYPDLQGFGRRQMVFTPEEIENLILYQLGALSAFSKRFDQKLSHVKPHGALYNFATKDQPTAMAIARAVLAFDQDLILVGLAGSLMVEVGEALGLRVANEGFPDRAYQADGSLMPRSMPGAVLTDPLDVADNALRLVKEGIVTKGQTIKIDTLCLHGDHPRAVQNAKAVRQALEVAGIRIVPL